jgi:signal peptidase I
MPKLARVAYVLAFLVAGLDMITAVMGRITLLPFALIPLVAGVGILRKRAWSAYGYALFQFSQLLLILLTAFRSGNSGGLPPDLVAGATLVVALIPLFLFAGRSLDRTGAERGSPLRWIAVSVLLTVPLVFVQAFVIPTGAMENTLLIGDHILAQCLPKPSPMRGDMIVFIYPIDRHQTFVKRIIGVPGDRIRASQKVVYRNGVALAERYAIHTNNYPDFYRDNFPSEPEPNRLLLDAAREMLRNNVVNGEVVVPSGKYFVLGDNRDNSLDSRYWGFISFSDCIGKPFLIYDSEDQSTEGIVGAKQAGPRRVRWERLFKLI